MRKSINVETVTSAIINKERARMWSTKVTELVQNYVANTTFKTEYGKQLKEELEFANANLELLSENDYNWLLEQQKSPTIDSTNDTTTTSFNCKICCDGHFSASAVQGKTAKSDVEVIAEFKKLIPGFTAAADKSKVGDAVATESQSTRWIVQITIGKDIYYRTLKTKNRMSPSIYDAKCYVSENAAKQAANSATIENRLLTLATVNSGNIAESCVLDVKEVLCTETSSRTIEIVKKPVNSTVKKVRKPKKVYLIQDKKTKQYVTKVDHSNFTEVDLDRDISEARLYTSMGNADSDCKYLSRYKDTNCKVQLEVVEMPDDEKFVLWSNGSLEFFVRIDSTGIKTTKNIDEATRYVSYKSASTAVKKTDKELPYRFSFSTVKNVKPLVVPVEKPVKKVKEPKVKEEWVLYKATPTSTFYYQSAMLGWSLVPKLEDATKFSSYSAAKAKCKLAKTDILGLEVGESKDCK